MTYNYSYLVGFPGAWLMHMSAHWYAAALTKQSKDLKFFDNRSPRAYLAKVTALEKQTPDQQKYIRAEAANANGVEAIPLFGLAIIAGNMARLPAETMNRFVFTWLGLRALYNVLYIGTNGHKLSFLRSLTFLGGILSTFNIFIKAGRVLNGGT
ncbi:BZ3500_MvSof-1268-A1-R1_Chr3-2g06282 [Microbotryum saponariae]|uniref:BZ3500_MvSof-1268-A1-R1_Chr3-2g06282 protein n=1 Tax=Microbotryum saponariae TaxID=289078 RepID=A0A2X0LQ25_9BASI|nr:BZ3500_MvSof-1268-A1-R1_Chr3-2g06282 [Microbotryum saponariae]SDA04253.1 BZ3501_MvSof-1269-A2-R1_Chr3-2g05973 [Microbotryum saponariae]